MMMRFLPLEPGDPVAISGYTLRGRLGAGGMGSVYLSHTRDGQPVAVKIIRRELAEYAEFRRRFTREVEAAQRVQSPYTARVVAADPDGPVPWLATSYVAGPSLATAVDEHGTFPVPVVLRLLAGVAQGIAAVHATGLIHRDLKPANVLLAADGPKVIDFGIAHAAASSTSISTLTAVGQPVGTPAFMAPEQILDRVTEATDIWALGHLALVAATGHNGFGDGNRDALFYRIINGSPNLDGCDPAIRPIIERCLAKDPAGRPTVAEVIAAADDALSAQTETVAGGSWLPRPVAESLADYMVPPPPPPRAVTQPSSSVPGYSGTGGTYTIPPGPPPQSPGIGGPYGMPAGSPSAPLPGPYSGQYPGPGPVQGVPPRRGTRRPLVIIGALAVVAVVAVAFEIGNAGGPSGGSPATSPSASLPGKTATTASSGGSRQASYAVKYSNARFTMPGGGCANGDVVQPSWVTFTGSGPQVSTGSGIQIPGSAGGDIDLDCELGDGNANPGIDFDGAQAVAQVSGSPSPSACVQDIQTNPEEGGIQFSTLSVGEQFCLEAASGLLVRVTLESLNGTSYDLTWAATAWQPPSAS